MSSNRAEQVLRALLNLDSEIQLEHLLRRLTNYYT